MNLFFSKVDLEEIMNRKDLKPESRKYSFSFIKKNKYYSNNIISHNIPWMESTYFTHFIIQALQMF